MPIKLSPGGNTSIKKPAKNPAIAPTAGPFNKAQLVKTTIKISGVAPGRKSFAKKVG